MRAPDGIPAELLDPDHPLWWDPGRYAAWMAARGWRLPARERMEVADLPDRGASHPVRARARRLAAAAGWAREQRVAVVAGGLPGWVDWRALRAMLGDAAVEHQGPGRT